MAASEDGRVATCCKPTPGGLVHVRLRQIQLILNLIRVTTGRKVTGMRRCHICQESSENNMWFGLLLIFGWSRINIVRVIRKLSQTWNHHQGRGRVRSHEITPNWSAMPSPIPPTHMQWVPQEQGTCPSIIQHMHIQAKSRNAIHKHIYIRIYVYVFPLNLEKKGSSIQ